MPEMRRSSWTGFALACLLAIAAGGAAADGGKHGGHDAGGKHSDHESGSKHGGRESGGKHSGPAGGGKHGGHDAGDRHGKVGGGRHGASRKGAAGNAPIVVFTRTGPEETDPFHRGKRRDIGLHKRLADDPNGTSTGQLVDAFGTAAIAARVILPGMRGSSLDLPATLQPPGDSANPSTESPTEPLPGVPSDVVRACHDAIAATAAPLGAIAVEVDSAGPIREVGPDIRSAPLEVSIGYLRQGGVEARRARVDCQLDATGSVIGLT